MGVSGAAFMEWIGSAAAASTVEVGADAAMASEAAAAGTTVAGATADIAAGTITAGQAAAIGATGAAAGTAAAGTAAGGATAGGTAAGTTGASSSTFMGLNATQLAGVGLGMNIAGTLLGGAKVPNMPDFSPAPGSQAAKAPTASSVQAGLTGTGQGGGSTGVAQTFLTGAGGVDPSKLILGKNTLLGQ